MPTKNIVLTDHQHEFVTQMVTKGHYQNASELLREGLRLVEQNYAEHQARLERAINEGLNSGVNPYSARTIIEQTKAKLNA